MCKKLIYAILLMLVLGLCEVQAFGQEWDRAAYWDGRYPSAWGGGGEAVRDALEAAGYTILDADQLKTWMDGHISDKELSVVVFCRDVVPDTVAETMSSDCTIRKYLDAGGKVVWYSDWPFYYQGSSDGAMVTWGSAGASSVLGFNASSGPNDSSEIVTITDEGATWGLTETWESRRPTSPTISENMTALATISGGSAGAWAKHFLPGDNYRGFVRTFDRDGAPSIIDDLIRLAEYTATKSGNPTPANGAFHPDTWASMGWGPGGFAASHDVYFGDNFNDVQAGAESTFLGNQVNTNFVVGFPGFPFPDGLVPGTTYYWRVDDVTADGVTKYQGDVWSFTVPPKIAYLPEPADGTASVAPDVELQWTGGFGSKLHYVYFGDNFDDVYNAAGALPQGTTTYTPGILKMAKTYYWRVDEFDIVQTYKGDVWSFTTEGAVEPIDPANGAVDITQTPVLTWTPGFGASHEIYFGSDKEAVKNADTSSPEYKGSGNLGSESYDPGQLEWNTTYYWRVDEANSTNADSPWTGPVWSFATASFLIIDDFEAYNDLDPTEAASNRIFNVWIDGFDNPATNGSVVGNANAPFAEQTIVHSGNQSMPFAYDNGVGKSEATLTLTSNRDWTVKGVNSLTIWYRGAPTNAAEPMYVVLNGSAGVDNDNPNAAQAAIWTEWNIDLQAFADQGVNLANVTSITLGLGNRANPVAGGAGMMYYDDIRLYAP
ncbi:MAG: hypothetical protein GY774_40270 [Planctomycetes bacterium]|nr:hypothetical protein [Planctomycetota bacterium]